MNDDDFAARPAVFSHSKMRVWIHWMQAFLSPQDSAKDRDLLGGGPVVCGEMVMACYRRKHMRGVARDTKPLH